DLRHSVELRAGLDGAPLVLTLAILEQDEGRSVGALDGALRHGQRLRRAGVDHRPDELLGLEDSTGVWHDGADFARAALLVEGGADVCDRALVAILRAAGQGHAHGL